MVSPGRGMGTAEGKVAPGSMGPGAEPTPMPGRPERPARPPGWRQPWRVAPCSMAALDGHTRVLQTSQGTGWVVRVSIVSLEVTPTLAQLWDAEKQRAGHCPHG